MVRKSGRGPSLGQVFTHDTTAIKDKARCTATIKIRRTTAARQRLQEGPVSITTHGQRDASKDKDRLIHGLDNESNGQYEQHPDGCSSDELAVLIVRGNGRGDLQGLRSHRQ